MTARTSSEAPLAAASDSTQQQQHEQQQQQQQLEQQQQQQEQHVREQMRRLPAINGDIESAAAAALASASDRYSIFEVVNVLTSFRANHERMKLFRVSLSVIRFLSILNFVYTILGVTFLMLALCTEWTPEFNDYQRNQFFRIGLTVSVFAPLASFVDLLALRGLQLWRRAYLLPWLFLYAFAVSLVFANSLAGVFHHGFSWTYLVLTLCAFCLYSAWRHVRRQYNEMARDRPVCRTIEELAEDLRHASAANSAASAAASAAAYANDLPPKYEDLDQPPTYSEEYEAAHSAQAAGAEAAPEAAEAAVPSSSRLAEEQPPRVSSSLEDRQQLKPEEEEAGNKKK